MTKQSDLVSGTTAPAFGRWLKERREQLGLSQDAAAQRAGIAGKSRGQQWSNYERSSVRPRRSMVIAMANALDSEPGEALRLAGYASLQSVAHPAAAANRELPRELQRAALLLNDPQVAEQLPPTSGDGGKVAIVSLKYTNILDGLSQMQTDLGQQIAEDLAEVGTEPVSPPDAETFDVSTSPEFGSLRRAIYTFPFFLSPARRRLRKWGVVPYALHWALGVIVHMDSALFKELKKYDPTRANGLAAPFHDRPDWLPTLIDFVAERQGNILVRQGHLHAEVMPLLTEYKGGDYPFKYIKILRSLRPDEHLKDHLSINSAAIVSLSNHLAFTPDKESPVISGSLQDFMYEGKDEETFKTKPYRLLRLHHHLLIPVGIGFTLATLPLLLEGNRWHSWARLILDSLNKPDISRQFAHIGIEINNELSRIIAFEGENFNPFVFGESRWR